jgi:hypothetical protein
MFVRRIVLVALLLALAIPASAPARQAKRPPAPTGLKAFLLNYNEPTKRNFPRTPSFAWKPIKRATGYEFQLATAKTFRENSVLWSSDTLKMPAVSVPLSLPWVTGKPFSLFARVRAKTQRGVTRWSRDYGFNVRWSQIPAQLSAPNGILRWTPIDGASVYQIVEMSDPSAYYWEKTYTVATNVTDMRDWYTLRYTPGWAGTAYWRVRAVRTAYGTSVNTQPSASYGPWSPLFRTQASAPRATRITLGQTVSDRIGTVAKPVPHELMPGLTWGSYDSYDLYRAYVFSDEDCVQPVFTGSIVGSPAWVPRLSGALELPTSMKTEPTAIFPDGVQEGALDAALQVVTPDENASDSSSDGGGSPSDSETTVTPKGDLWDREWPSGVYYWTVVPVEIFASSESELGYRDVELPQDVCAAGRKGTFGRVSKPIPTGSKKAYVIGLTVKGRMKSMAAARSPRVYGTPLVTWTPVLGADGFEIQWSHKRYPFRKVGSLTTPATSALLSLEPGTWYYRVRGLNLKMPTAAQAMSWSSVRKVRIAKPVFRVK